MIFETDKSLKARRIKWIIDTCFDSLKTRRDLYERRRRFYLFGTATDEEVKYNRLLSHLDLVSSFLYSPEHAMFNIAAHRNAEDIEIKRAVALQDEWNDDFRDWGLADLYGELLDWALTFDTMFIKMGWNDVRDDAFGVPVAPDAFGVFDEAQSDLDSQQAFCHRIYIDYDNAVQRLQKAGLRDKIPRLVVTNTPFISPFPELLTRMIITATGGENLAGSLMGAVNPLYEAKPTYAAKIDRPLVEFFEVTAWDDNAADWRTFHVCDPDIVITDSAETVDALLAAGKFKPDKKKMNGGDQPADTPFFETKTNLFLPKEHPFVKIQPHSKFDYFWGRAHIDTLIPLQEWSSERLEQISDILEKQAYPARVGSGFMGLTDDKMDAFGGADTWVYDQLPNAKIEELKPTMPQDLFAEFSSIGQIFLECSGLTDIIAGQGSPGVRSRGHAKELKKSGAGRITKLAVGLEPSLVRLGDLGIKLKMKNDDDPIMPDPTEDGQPGKPFYAAQVHNKLKIKIQGHSHSPLFHDDTQQLAFILFKAQAVDQEHLIRLLNPPNRDNLIHALRARLARMAKQRALAPPAPAGRKGSNKEAQHG